MHERREGISVSKAASASAIPARVVRNLVRHGAIRIGKIVPREAKNVRFIVPRAALDDFCRRYVTLEEVARTWG